MKTIKVAKGLSFPVRQPALAVRKVSPPRRLVYPTGNRWGWLYPEVKEGDAVGAGQVIASSSLPYVPSLKTAISGTVREIIKLPTLQLRKSQAIVIEAAEDVSSVSQSVSIGEDASPVEVFKAIMDAGIWEVDDYALPLHLRVAAPEVIEEYIKESGESEFVESLRNIPYRDRAIETLIVNALDRQPQSWVRSHIFASDSDRIVAGVRLLQRLSGAKQTIVAVPSHLADSESTKKVMDALKAEVTVSNGKYPASLEPILILALTGKEMVFPSKNSRECGVAVVDVMALEQLVKAVLEGNEDREVTVQVNLSGRREYHLLKCPVGTPVLHIIDHLALNPDSLTKVVLGGDFLGYAHYDLDVPITGEVDVLSLWDTEIFHYKHDPCIRCGFCVRVCPMNLVPAEISMYCEYNRFEEAVGKGIYHCIECGLCSYVCPSHRPMVQLIRHGKQELERAREVS